MKYKIFERKLSFTKKTDCPELIEFIETYIRDPHGNSIELTNIQKELLGSINNNQFNIITKPRQVGATSAMIGYIAKDIIFSIGVGSKKTINITSTKQESASEIIHKVSDILFNIGFTPTSSSQNKLTYNGGLIKLLATGPNIESLLGYHPDHIYFDEFSFMNNLNLLLSNAMMSLNTGGKINLISSLGGVNTLESVTDEYGMFNVVEL